MKKDEAAKKNMPLTMQMRKETQIQFRGVGGEKGGERKRRI